MVKSYTHLVSIKILLITLLVCLLTIVVTVRVKDCSAKDKKSQHYSKDYKAFPNGSPEAIVTAFVEADLGDIFNRENDDRYYLWWDLTEREGAPEDCQRLIINSYKIARKRTEQRTGDIIVDLEMDVRAVQLVDDILKNETNETRNYCKWRGIIRADGNRFSLLNTRGFVEQIFGNNDNTVSILQKKGGYYVVPKGKRKWTFEIRLVNKKSKWLISNDSIPIVSSYIGNIINDYKKYISGLNRMNEVCDGKRVLDKSILAEYEFGDDKKIALNFQKYKAKYCAEDRTSNRNDAIKEFASIIRLLESAKGD